MKCIYGLPEEIWVRILESAWHSGQRDSAFIASILRRCGVRSRSKILDLGCGIGRIAVRLALAKYKVVGVDISSLCIERAQKYAEKYHVKDKLILEVGDYRKLEKIDVIKKYKPFDAVLLILTLTWTNFNEMTNLFKNIGNVIKEEGVLIIQEPCREFYLLTLINAFPNSFKWIDRKMLYMVSRKINCLQGVIFMKIWVYEKVNNKTLRLVMTTERRYYIPTLKEYVKALRKAKWKVKEVIHRPIIHMKPPYLESAAYTHMSSYIVAVKH